MKRIIPFLLGVLLLFSAVLPQQAAFAAQSSTLTPKDVDVKGVGTLSKTAVRTAADEWEVTLKIITAAAVKPRPMQVVLLLDTSGSMAWCTQAEHKHGKDCYTLACTQVHAHEFKWALALQGTVNEDNCYALSCTESEHSHAEGSRACEGVAAEKSRQYLAAQAAQQLLQGLWDSGADCRVSVVSFAGSSAGYGNYTDTASVRAKMTQLDSEKALTALKNAIPDSGAVGATCLNDGLLLANKQFKNDDSMRVLVVLSDGEYNAQDPLPTAQTIKQAGTLIYSVGFMYTGETMRKLASEGCYSAANSGATLKGIFETIKTELCAMVEDKAGSSFAIVSDSVSTSGVAGEWSVASNTLYWRAKETIPANSTVTIKYTLKLKELTLGENNGVFEDVPLNEYAKLIYSVKKDTCEQALFPQPRAHYEVGLLRTVYVGLPQPLTPAASEQYRITDFGSAEFTVSEPEAAFTDGDDVYYHAYSLYTEGAQRPRECGAETQTVIRAKTGVNLLEHHYRLRVLYDVVYNDGVPNEDIEVPEKDRAEGGSEYTVASQIPVRAGYTFKGWEYNGRLYLAGDLLAMPQGNVTLTASWRSSIPNTGDSEGFYVLLVLLSAAAAAGIWLSIKRSIDSGK